MSVGGNVMRAIAREYVEWEAVSCVESHARP